MKKKKKKWLKLRHKIIRILALWAVKLYCLCKYGIEIQPFKEQENRPYLILLNHQTVFDQFFVDISFKGPVYYMATEDIFSNGWVSSLIRWLVAPIPIKKQTTDASAVMNCMRVAREGGTICIAPEGNRTYSGKTEYMNPAIAVLARKLKMPIALYRIEGGYGVQPRWCDSTRKGKMRAFVSHVIKPEEYAGFTNEELMNEIENGLYVNEAVADCEFYSKKRAEYLERAVYVCPFCGLSKFESHGNEIECLHCHRKISYGIDKKLTGVGFDFPFEFVNDWYEYQKDFVNNLDVFEYTERALYCDKADLYEVIINKKKNLLNKACEIKLFGDKVIIDQGKKDKLYLSFDDLYAVSVLGRNKLNIYSGDKVYQFKGGKRFNALKYVNIYYRYENLKKGEQSGKFLGL